MKNIPFLLLIVILATSCKSTQNTSPRRSKVTKQPTKVVTKRASKPTPTSITKAAKDIIKEAKTYKGTKYKYGGNTKRGIDCSGLIHNAFTKHGVSIARTTSALSKTGNWVDIKKVIPGDLVFFATKKNSRNVNHVGIVSYVNGDNFKFIHSTTSRGVIESEISERYWYLAYVQARRYL